jgi:DNA-binding PadR family transcriptional regulator
MFQGFKRYGFCSPVIATVGVGAEFWGSPFFAHGRHRNFCGGRGGKDWFSPEFGEGFRTPRGDIKFMLLELLSEGPAHGYDLIKAAENRYGGFRRLSPGSVYPTLQMLEEGGYVTSVQEGGKKIYTITDEGRQLLEERSPSSSSSGEAFNDRWQELMELRRVATELSTAVVTVVRSGDRDRVHRVRELLEQVRREIYSILAE